MGSEDLSREEIAKYLAMIEKWIKENHDDPAKIEFVYDDFLRCDLHKDALTQVNARYRLTNSQGMRKLYSGKFTCSKFILSSGSAKEADGGK
jgi:hypothetical protein